MDSGRTRLSQWPLAWSCLQGCGEPVPACLHRQIVWRSGSLSWPAGSKLGSNKRDFTVDRRNVETACHSPTHIEATGGLSEFASIARLRVFASATRPAQAAERQDSNIVLLCTCALSLSLLLVVVEGSKASQATLSGTGSQTGLGISSANAAMENTGFDYIVKPLGDFTKNSIRLVKRCTKPDRKGAHSRSAAGAITDPLPSCLPS